MTLTPEDRATLARAYPGATGRRTHDSDRPMYAGTVWTRDVRQMPLAANSGRLAEWMHHNRLNRFIGPGRDKPFGDPTGLNRTAFGTDPIPVYIIDSSVPGVPRMQGKVGYATFDDKGEKHEMLEKDIPVPLHVKPARNQDKGLAIWDTHTGIMREWFHWERQVDGTFKAIAGGWTRQIPGFPQMHYSTQLDVGSNSVVAMHNQLGFIDAEEVLAGEIKHALAFTASTFAWNSAASWPAKLTDGKAPAAEESPTHGQWGRVRPEVDPTHDPLTGKPYKPLTQLLIRAAQRYGLCPTDTNTWVHAFNTTSSHELIAAGLDDPWAPGGAVEKKLGTLDISDFPWYLTDWAPIDWGKPAEEDPSARMADDTRRRLAPYTKATDVQVPGLSADIAMLRGDRLPPMLVVDHWEDAHSEQALRHAVADTTPAAEPSELPAPVLISHDRDSGIVEMEEGDFRRLLWSAYARAERKPEDGDYNPDWV